MHSVRCRLLLIAAATCGALTRTATANAVEPIEHLGPDTPTEREQLCAALGA